MEEKLKQLGAKLKDSVQKDPEKFLSAASEQERSGMQNLKKFVQLIFEDASVAAKVQEIGFNSPNAVIGYAKELGFEFDQQDMEEFGNIVLGQSDELSEEELAKVSGGWLFRRKP